MNENRPMYPVSFMLDAERHTKLKDASHSTRISMSELVRISIDRLMADIGDPRRPKAAALARLLEPFQGER